MVKQRMTSLDVRATVEEMRSKLVGLRLLNLYDLNPTMFEFKFGHGENKHSILLESGVRFHLTELVREKPRIPSQFTLKIRKHVRAWRLDSITQLQNDRTIDMCFGVASSSGCFHIIIELFSKGNIILTDHNYTIMMLLRTHKDTDVKLAVHNTYPITTPLELENTKNDRGITKYTSTQNANSTSNNNMSEFSGENEAEKVAVLRAEWLNIFHRQPEYETTRSTLSAIRHFGNSLADHILTKTHIRSVKKKDMKVSPEELFDQMLPGILEAWYLARAALPAGGYLISNSVEHGAQQQQYNNKISKAQMASANKAGDNLDELCSAGNEESGMSERAQRHRAKKKLLQKEHQLAKENLDDKNEPDRVNALRTNTTGVSSAIYKKANTEIEMEHESNDCTPEKKDKENAAAIAAADIDVVVTSSTNESHEGKKEWEQEKKNESTKKGAMTLTSDVSETHVNITDVVKHYDDFSPILLAQYTLPHVQTVFYNSFGKVCDAFFLPTETEKITQHNTTSQQKALSKREKFERDHARRVGALEQEQELNQRRGEMIICNAEIIDEAIGLINGALAAGLQWDALHSVLKRRHAEGHPVAYIIHDLFLERNSISVLLENDLYEDEDDKDVKAMVVEVMLDKTAHANATMYFGKMKANQVKLSKTLAATEKAAAGAARKGDKAAAKTKAKKQIVKIRNKRWWEKFRWFRTSAGDVVLQGKDAQSTDLLLRRFMCVGDLFIFTDVDNALPCLLRPMNREVWHIAGNCTTSTSTVNTHFTDVALTPPSLEEEELKCIALSSVEEAGGFCVSMSGAWENKQTVGAWWICASQLTGGGVGGVFTFTGDRHHILPQPLALGCGLLFEVQRDIRETCLNEHAIDFKTEDANNEVNNEARNNINTVNEKKTNDFVLLGDEIRHALLNEANRIARDSASTLHDLPNEKTKKVTYNNNTNTKSVSPSFSSLQKKESKEIKNVAASNTKNKISRQGQEQSAELSSSLHLSSLPTNTSTLQEYQETLSLMHTKHVNNKATAISTNNSSSSSNSNNVSKSLTNRQKRKLKKIKDKYHDQDDEDRMLGAQLNGNQLSKIQLQELEVQREQANSNNNNNNAAKGKNNKRGNKKSKSDSSRRNDTEEHNNVFNSRDEEEFVAGKKCNEVVKEIENDGDEEDSESFETISTHSADNAEPLTTEEAADHIVLNEKTITKEENHDITQSLSLEEVEEKTSSCKVESLHECDEFTNQSEDNRGHSMIDTNKYKVDSEQEQPFNKLNDVELKRALPFFTCTPESTDIIVHVFSVCAPFRTLVNYPYRVELATGNAKKGQAAHAILEHFKQIASNTNTANHKINTIKKTYNNKNDNQSTSKHNKSLTSSITTTDNEKSDDLSEGVSSNDNNNVKEALAKIEVDEMIEQLRGNAKPLKLRV